MHLLFTLVLITGHMAFGAYQDVSDQHCTFVRYTRSLYIPHWQAPERPKPIASLDNFALHCHEAATLQKAQTLVTNTGSLDPADIVKAYDTTRMLLEGLLTSTQTGDIPDVPDERANCFAYLTYMDMLYRAGTIRS